MRKLSLFSKITETAIFCCACACSLCGCAGATPSACNASDQLTNQFIAQSTTTYDYGFADGQENERSETLNLIERYRNGLSDDDQNCFDILTALENEIRQKDYGELLLQ